jgi:hypothetical protein
LRSSIGEIGVIGVPVPFGQSNNFRLQILGAGLSWLAKQLRCAAGTG